MSCPQTSLMTRTSANQVVSILQGHLDEVAARLLGSLSEQIEASPRLQTILDLSEAGDLTAAGVAALLDLQQRALANGGTLELRGASATLQSDLIAAGLGTLFSANGPKSPDQGEGIAP